MQKPFIPFKVVSIEKDTIDTFVLKLEPVNGEKLHFQAGQYAVLRNPNFTNPAEEHTFSFASSPHVAYLEFGMRIYGKWTKALSQLVPDAIVEVAGPYGEVVWDKRITSVVFLVGGVGISPIMSVLRTIAAQTRKPQVTLLYGSRTPEAVSYKTQVENIMSEIPGSRLVHVFSHLAPTDPWSGYQGFITAEVIRKEVNLENQPHFYMFGPPIFVEKMQELLGELKVAEDKVHAELH